ncbi:glycoside hydrolase family 28 protein [Phycomyces blakesleeanus]|uniref:Glycoside hydrolase family 28 protein n=2 Tax=Phycomyces blakesleeanus TaxID=4837 RepID=A0A162Y960_PHYB8|nr:glycoside hydrolase family 28 protein [Phycomyces blakesleeanus NRRL 1555(-)]OAD79105.1 glycoside hydrolase family 28 protein [Phycomyces blakesleeanus NRRL 1555(-)]|eukprot:XP_018297145.1 glycoside hydrolase family 28 protein [Phycomyces blakesleeanus NRRL 1555(-)]
MKFIGASVVASVFLLSTIAEAGRTCVVGHSGNNNEVAPIMKAFKDCNNGGTVVFPAGQTYNVKSALELQGLKNIVVKFDSIINFPRFNPKIQKGKGYMYFNGDNIHFSGRGTINGNGQGWFDAQNNQGPTMVRVNARNSYFAGFTVKQAPNGHFSIVGSQNTILENLSLRTVSTNPSRPAKNTDAFGISSSSNIIIRDSTIVNGDDCLAVHGGVTNATISGITCTGGHGFSVGSLGKDGITESLSGVSFLNNKCINCTSGLRIKAWPGGKGNVNDIRFENTSLQNVESPIDISTHYCDKERASQCARDDATSLSFTNIKIKNVSGTGSTNKDYPLININCAAKNPCKNIVLSDIHLTPSNSKTKKNVCLNLVNSGAIPYCKL